MVKFLFVFMCLFLGKIVFAQSLARARATATIMHSVGAGELQAEGMNNSVSFSIVPSQTVHGKNNIESIKEVDFTTFRIVGNTFVYSLGIQPETTATAQWQSAKNKLSNFTVKPSAVDTEAFVLGSLVDVECAGKGNYEEHTKVAVIVHFN